MKCSQTQLFQGVFSVLPFFSTTQCSRTQSFSQTTPQKLKQQCPEPCSTPGTSLSLPTAFQVQESRWLCFLFPSLHSPILAAEMLLTRKNNKPHRGGGLSNTQPGQANLEPVGKSIPGQRPYFPAVFSPNPSRDALSPVAHPRCLVPFQHGGDGPVQHLFATVLKWSGKKGITHMR